MDGEPKTEEDGWTVEPPKKDHQRLKKALRVALIVAALGAVALVGVALFGENYIRINNREALLGLIVENPRPEVCVDQSAEIQEAEAYSQEDYSQNVISGDELE